MPLARTMSIVLAGLDAQLVTVEADVSQGLPKMVWTGLPDTAVRQSENRVKSAVRSSREKWPLTTVTVGLLPASVRKTGSGFDLPVAVAILAAQNAVDPLLVRDLVVIGGLGLDGRVHHVTGVLPAVIGAVQRGYLRIIVPRANAGEAALVPGAEVTAVGSLAELCARLRGEPVEFDDELPPLVTVPDPPPDLADVVGQTDARRALEVAAAGGHHLFMTGPPGVGKTMLAERLPSLLPDLSIDQALEVTSIHSLQGRLPVGRPLIVRPPFCAPHHTATVASLIGGGSGIPSPGTISLAHHGVLFVDEAKSRVSLQRDEGQVPRVLGVVRLSRDTDESTSVERQRAVIESWASQNDHTVIGWAEDVDVSGSVSPFERPSLGPWLLRSDEWDVLAAWRLDRVTRRVLHLASLMEWCKEEGKTLATTSEGFDMSSSMGRVFVQILGALAEGELEAIRERAGASTRHLIKSGRWRGGIVPFGYRPGARAADGSLRLEIDPDNAAVLREIVRRIVDEGQAANAVVRWLNDSKIPTSLDSQRVRMGKEPTGSTWRVANLLKTLRSPSLLGHAEMTDTIKRADGKTEKVTRVVRSADGMPLQRAEPLLTQDEWASLQAKLVANGNPRAGNRVGGSLLLQVAFCECGQPLYRNSGRNYPDGDKRYFYRCGSAASSSQHCGNPSINARELESHVIAYFLLTVGDTPMTRRVLVPGDNSAGQLEAAKQSRRELMEDRRDGIYSSESGKADFRRMLAEVEAKVTTLEAMPAREDEWIDEPTGQTYREVWESIQTTAERNRELRNAGMEVQVFRLGSELLPPIVPQGTRIVTLIRDGAVARVNPVLT